MEQMGLSMRYGEPGAEFAGLQYPYPGDGCAGLWRTSHSLSKLEADEVDPPDSLRSNPYGWLAFGAPPSTPVTNPMLLIHAQRSGSGSSSPPTPCSAVRRAAYAIELAERAASEYSRTAASA